MSSSWCGTAKSPPRDSLILQAEFAAEYAVRQGPWKLIERVPPPEFHSPSKEIEKRILDRRKHWPNHNELYNLQTDPAEKQDVSLDHPEIVERLAKLLKEGRGKGATRPGALTGK